MIKKLLFGALCTGMFQFQGISQEVKDWAFYGYFVGDDKTASLETSQVKDMIELKDGIVRDNAYVVVQHDRSEKTNRTLKNFYFDPNYSGVSRYEIESNGISSVQKIGEKNMGDAQTFFNFLDWAMKNYPAKNVVLTVNAHGSGVLSWSGPTSVQDNKSYDDVYLDVNPDSQFVGYDHTGDSLTIIEFRRVLEEIKKKYSQSKIKVIIFDACLSEMVEVMSDLKNVTQIVLGSATTIPGTGMDYRAVTRAMNHNMDPVKLSKYIAEAFIDSVGNDNLISAYDLSTMDVFEEKLDAFSMGLIDAMNSSSRKGIRNLRNYSDNYWDIYTIAKSVRDGDSDLSRIGSLVRQAGELVQAQRAMNLVTWTKGEWKGTLGLSIFWPGKDDYKKYRNFYKKLSFAKEHKWDEFLDRFILKMQPQIFDQLYSN
ncbi:clostripain-related cysteine peptidase [bacterium]|nr:clostripain-related cysteine peptidase [bacterium]